MLKQNTIGVSLEKFINLKCTNIINKTLYEYVCYYDNNINSCCNSNINLFFNYLNNTKIEQDKCYIYNNNSYNLECSLISYKYHLFVYVMLVLFIIINLIVLIYGTCYCIKYRKYNRYREIENNILIYKSNSIYSRNNDEYDDCEI